MINFLPSFPSSVPLLHPPPLTSPPKMAQTLFRGAAPTAGASQGGPGGRGCRPPTRALPRPACTPKSPEGHWEARAGEARDRAKGSSAMQVFAVEAAVEASEKLGEASVLLAFCPALGPRHHMAAAVASAFSGGGGATAPHPLNRLATAGSRWRRTCGPHLALGIRLESWRPLAAAPRGGLSP